MLKEKATWNSFSGSLKKIEKDLLSIPSIRGARYFGPSKMSFFNLLKHSLSIISVFRKTVLIRSAFFIVFYILLIKSNASIITSIPLVLLLVMIYSISSLALRENMMNLKNAWIIFMTLIGKILFIELLMKNFFRKVAFGLKPDEKAPSDPLTWAQKQVETIPELNWKGKHIYSEKEMRKYWITQRVEENTTLRKKYKNDPKGLKELKVNLKMIQVENFGQQ